MLDYFKENLKHTAPEFGRTLKEYQEGLLVFDLMQNLVWEKSSKDSLGLQSYFDQNKVSYNFSDLNENRGMVLNDYQIFLENEMLNSLKRNFKVVIRKKIVQKLIKHYKLNE